MVVSIIAGKKIFLAKHFNTSRQGYLAVAVCLIVYRQKVAVRKSELADKFKITLFINLATMPFLSGFFSQLDVLTSSKVSHSTRKLTKAVFSRRKKKNDERLCNVD